MMKMSFDEFKALGPSILNLVALVEVDSGRLHLKKRFSVVTGISTNYICCKEYEDCSMSLFAVGAMSKRDTFWDEFAASARRTEEKKDLSYDELLDSFSTMNIYSIPVRSIGNFVKNIVSGKYLIVFSKTLGDTIRSCMEIMGKEFPVKMKVLDYYKVNDACDDFASQLESQICCNLAAGGSEGVYADFYIYDKECSKVNILTMKTLYEGQEGYQTIGELAGIFLSKLPEVSRRYKRLGRG